MRHPAIGLLWHSWRLSRRWYLLILAIALAATQTIMNLSPPGIVEVQDFRAHLAPGTVVFTTMLALFTTLVAVSLGGRAGFPLRFEFRLPVSAGLLAGMPMLALGALCASLYVIPMLVIRVLYGLPMPVMAGAVLVFMVATLLAAASWTTATNLSRGVALVLAVSACTRLLTWMQPFHFRQGARTGEPAFDPRMLSFSALQYVLIILLIVTLYGLVVHGIRLQRQDERWLARAPQPLRSPGLSQARDKERSGENLIDRAAALLQTPSPVSSPWAAELWLECKRLGVPLLALALLMALLMPVLPWADSLLGSRMTKPLATAAPVVLFFIGVGLGIFNRRIASGGYMNPFEGTRALGTLPMAGIQLGALGAALTLGTGVIGVGVWLSSPLYDDLGPLWSRLGHLLQAVRGGNIAQQAGTATTLVAGLLSIMAFLFCVHSCSMFWGRKVMYGALAFLIYAVIFAHTALTDPSAGAFVAKNMWWLAGGTLSLTLLLLFPVARLRLLSLRAGTMALVVWLLGVGGAVLMLQRLDVHLPALAPELKVLNAALVTLPLTLFLCTVWCYDRLRHR